MKPADKLKKIEELFEHSIQKFNKAVSADGLEELMITDSYEKKELGCHFKKGYLVAEEEFEKKIKEMEQEYKFLYKNYYDVGLKLDAAKELLERIQQEVPTLDVDILFQTVQFLKLFKLKE